jgi:hypothetical protein
MVYVNASISVQKTASNLWICYLRLGDCIFMFSCSVYSHTNNFSLFLYYRPLLCDSCCHHSVDSINSSFYRLSRQQINQQVDIFLFLVVWVQDQYRVCNWQQRRRSNLNNQDYFSRFQSHLFFARKLGFFFNY